MYLFHTNDIHIISKIFTSTLKMETVIKRSGKREPIDLKKITNRLKKLKNDAEKYLGRKLEISLFKIAQQTISQVYDGIHTGEMDEQAAYVSAYTSDHPDYNDFAGIILVSNLEKENKAYLDILEYAKKAYGFIEERTNHHAPIISKELLTLIEKNRDAINERIVLERNYLYDYFALQTLIRGKYLASEYREVRKNKVTSRQMVPFETPQHMWMRVALGICGGDDLEAAFDLYDHLSLKHGTMATPTLFNAGTPHSQLSSCFVAGTEVLTRQGYKNIEDIKAGDETMTHKNRWNQSHNYILMM